MKRFLDQLEGELSTLASGSPARTAALPERPHFLRSRRTATTLAATAVAVVALGTLPWVAERTERLSPLAAPAASAAAHAGRPGVPPAGSYDLSGSRAFSTPDGPGFVVTSKDGGKRCLVLPDRFIPESFGSSCGPAPRFDRAGTLGLMVQARTARAAGRTLVGFVLPRNASGDTQVTVLGQDVPVSVERGVAVAVVHDRAVLHYRIAGRNRTVRIPAPFLDSGKGAVQCRDGRMVEFRLPAAPSAPGTVPPPLRTARYCR